MARRMAWLAPLVAAGCGGGGGGGGGSGTATGLSVPSQISVVTSQSSGSSSSVGPFAPDSDYETDVTHVHVYDSALDPINSVNGILCMLGQTRYTDLVNHGPYLAQVDENQCQTGGDPSSSGQSGTTTNLSTWTVNSTRANANAAQFVRLWVPSANNDVADGTIRARIRVDEGVSAANPFGVFHLDYALVDNAAPDLLHPIFHGVLATQDAASGFLGFEFYEQQGDTTVDPGAGHGAQTVQAAVNMVGDQSAGVAHILRTWRDHYGPTDSGQETDEYLLAFNDQHLLKQVNGGATVAYDRTAPTDHVWSYNLYHATGPDAGKRVELDSGFPFRTQNGDWGYVGYYGVWTPPGITVADGDTIERASFGDDTAEQYTLRIAPGKLYHMTRQSLDLTALSGIEFEWFDYVYVPGSRTRVRYVGGSEGFVITGLFDPQNNRWTDISPAFDMDEQALGFLNLYSAQLNGPCFYTWGQTDVSYFDQDVVRGDDGAFGVNGTVDLYGYQMCLDAEITGAYADQGFVYVPQSNDVNAPLHYVFDQATLALYFDVNGDGSDLREVGLAPGEHVTTGPNFWGMRSGPMVVSTAGFTTVQDLFAQSDYYVYETGENPWNKLAGVEDPLTHDFYDFDPPLSFTYTHLQANDRNNDAAHDGETYVLNYGGPGQLGGLPFSAIDLDNDGNPDRFYPLVNLADGVLVGPTGTEYVVRAIDVEQTLAVDVAGAPELNLTGAALLTVPDGSNYTVPDNGTAPVVTDPPAVVAGELQGSLQSANQ